MTAPIFLYDGDCAFCTACARLIRRRVPTPARVSPWQSVDLSRLGLTRAQCEAAVQWIGADGIRAAGPDAIARLLGTSGPAWRAIGLLLRMPPVRLLAWPAYEWVARNRHRVPSGMAACGLPRRAGGGPG